MLFSESWVIFANFDSCLYRCYCCFDGTFLATSFAPSVFALALAQGAGSLSGIIGRAASPLFAPRWWQLWAVFVPCGCMEWGKMFTLAFSFLLSWSRCWWQIRSSWRRCQKDGNLRCKDWDQSWWSAEQMKSDVSSISPQVLLHHVVSGMAVTRDMIANDALVPTVEGSIHRVNVYLKSNYYDVRNRDRSKSFNPCCSPRVLLRSTESGSRHLTSTRATELSTWWPKSSTLSFQTRPLQTLSPLIPGDFTANV